MSVTIRIPYIFYHLTSGVRTIETAGRTIGECLCQLHQEFPEIKSRLFDDQGQLYNFVELYLNNRKIGNGLDFPVHDKDELRIYVMIVGG